MSYILYSVPVKLRHLEIQVPPISVYHMRKLIELRDSGVDIANPKAKDFTTLVDLVVEVIQENHPEITSDTLQKELDTFNLKAVMDAMQNAPKNVTAQTGMTQANQELGKTQSNPENKEH